MNTARETRPSGPNAGRRDAGPRRMTGFRTALEPLEGRQLLSTATFTWTGAGDQVHWSDAKNWQGGQAPGGPAQDVSKDQVVFPANGQAGSSDQDIPGLTVGAISALATPGAAGGTIEVGAATAVTGDVRLDPGTALSVDAGQSAAIGSLSGGGSVRLAGASSTLKVGVDGTSTTFSGPIRGAGTLDKVGAGALTLASPSPGAGQSSGLAVDGGTLAIDAGATGGSAPGYAVAVHPGGTLSGSLGVDSVSVARGGTVAPGGVAPGTLAVSGDATFSAGSTLAIRIGGSASDRLDAGGTVNLGGSTLGLAAIAPPIGAGASVTIVHAGQLTGRFANLADGQTIQLGGAAYTARYGGQDIVLTRSFSGTALALSTAATAPVSGDAVTLTASVSGTSGPASGAYVSFYDGSIKVADVPVVANMASYTFHPLAGPHVLTAIFSGDSLDAASESAPVFLRVGLATPTVTAPSTTANPTVAGWPVTLLATVATPPGGAVPTGRLTLLDGRTPIGSVYLDRGGVASLTTSALSPGLHAITAAYQGDSQYLAASGLALAVSVGPVATGLTLTSTAPAAGGQSWTLTATASAPVGTPTGTVTFLEGRAVLGTATLDGSGHAALASVALAPGSDAITATYAGDATHLAASTAPLTPAAAPSPTAPVAVAPTATAPVLAPAAPVAQPVAVAVGTALAAGSSATSNGAGDPTRPATDPAPAGLVAPYPVSAPPKPIPAATDPAPAGLVAPYPVSAPPKPVPAATSPAPASTVSIPLVPAPSSLPASPYLAAPMATRHPTRDQAWRPPGQHPIAHWQAAGSGAFEQLAARLAGRRWRR